MNDLLTVTNTIPSTSPGANAYLMEQAIEMSNHPEQVFDPPIEHWITDGIYYRATAIPPYSVIVSCMIKPPTDIVVVGNCLVTVGDHVEHLLGMRHIKASPNRRVAYKSLDGDVFILMYFKTKASTVEEAEKEMTDEVILLTNHRKDLEKE